MLNILYICISTVNLYIINTVNLVYLKIYCASMMSCQALVFKLKVTMVVILSQHC